jgi:hypothetical protein
VPQNPPRRKDRVQTPEQNGPGILVFVQVMLFCCNPLHLAVNTLHEVYGVGCVTGRKDLKHEKDQL